MATRPIWARVWQSRQSWREKFSSPNPRMGGIGTFGYYMFIFATWVPVINLFKTSVMEITTINGPSMYPFFNPDKDRSLVPDVVINYKWDAKYELRRGMIITFWNPFNPEAIVVKRIVGLEGDVIKTHAPYPHPKAQVPAGHIWVEGDGEARDTRDSNHYGPIATELILGKVTHIVWPPSRAGRIRWWEYTGKPKS